MAAWHNAPQRTGHTHPLCIQSQREGGLALTAATRFGKPSRSCPNRSGALGQRALPTPRGKITHKKVGRFGSNRRHSFRQTLSLMPDPIRRFGPTRPIFPGFLQAVRWLCISEVAAMCILHCRAKAKGGMRTSSRFSPSCFLAAHEYRCRFHDHTSLRALGIPMVVDLLFSILTQQPKRAADRWLVY